MKNATDDPKNTNYFTNIIPETSSTFDWQVFPAASDTFQFFSFPTAIIFEELREITKLT